LDPAAFATLRDHRFVQEADAEVRQEWISAAGEPAGAIIR
jgi:hypothetical protein